MSLVCTFVYLSEPYMYIRSIFILLSVEPLVKARLKLKIGNTISKLVSKLNCMSRDQKFDSSFKIKLSKLINNFFLVPY